MAKKTEKEVKTATVTRAEKTDAAKSLVREVLKGKALKRTEVIDEAARLYAERYPSGETENANDVKGRIGSVLDVMKKDGEVLMDGGVCSLKSAETAETAQAVETPKETVDKPVEKLAEKTEKKDKKTAAKKVKTTEEKAETLEKTKAVKTEKTEKKSSKKTKTIELKVVPTEDKKAIAGEETVKEEKPKKARGKKAASTDVNTVETAISEEKEVPVSATKTESAQKKAQEKTEEKPKKTRVSKKKAETATPVAPVETVSEKPVEELPKPAETPIETEQTPNAAADETAVADVKTEETPKEEKTELASVEPAKEDPKTQPKEEKKSEEKETVFDMTLLFADSKPAKAKKPVVEKSADKPAEKFADKPVKTEETPVKETPAAVPEPTAPLAEKTVEKTAEKPTEKLAQKQERPQVKTELKTEKTETKKENKSESQPAQKPARGNRVERAERTERAERKPAQRSVKPLTADEALKEAFLKKLRSLGGTYFEYYAVYLLERYSMKNGRRLEGLRVGGGDRDGGIDGEIELTDKFGFKETIYIQAKNWNPDKGDEKKWVVGETLLQQFLGACMHRKAKDGKQHVRGIFMTMSHFTTEAKRLLADLSDCLVGYDENDVYEAAKECSFGVVQRNGAWVLDEKLLSGEKAFFDML